MLRSGVSTSFEVGGWKMKAGGSDEARGRRKFEIWSVCDAFSSNLAKKLRLLEHC